jgi:hypothetical protein
VSEPDRLRLLETLKVLKSNLTSACEASMEKRKRAGHGRAGEVNQERHGADDGRRKEGNAK